MKFQIEVIKSKIHRVTVTQADLNYVGSITKDNKKDLLHPQPTDETDENSA